MQNPTIRYDAKILQPGVDLDLSGVGSPSITARYGDYGGVGEIMNIKARCSVTISYSSVEATINDDGSATVVGSIAPVILHRVASGNPSTNEQHVKVWFDNKVVFDKIIKTGSGGDYNLNVPSKFSVTIPPSFTPQEVYPAAIHVLNDNINYPDNTPDEWALGVLITNPNKPLYRPGMVLDNRGKYLSHNRNGGASNIFSGGRWEWETMTTFNGGVKNDNPPSIRHINGYRNMRKIGLN